MGHDKQIGLRTSETRASSAGDQFTIREEAGQPVASTGFITVLTTAGSDEEADRIAQMLVTRQLAACVQRAMVNSTYVWDGKLNNDPEHLLLIKTRAELFPEVEAAIKSVHSYETPEIICLPIIAASEKYLGWLSRNTLGAKPKIQP